jgi:hypothetical protein
VRPAAGHLALCSTAGETDANREPFGVLVFAGVGFAVRRGQEESSAPHLRLAYIHLRSSFPTIYRPLKKEKE